jgi:glutamate/tyrosine decarboxylase-like PLP-dependent enzyme
VLARYGLVYPGIGWVLFRSKEYLPESLVFHDNYLGTGAWRSLPCCPLLVSPKVSC